MQEPRLPRWAGAGWASELKWECSVLGKSYTRPPRNHGLSESAQLLKIKLGKSSWISSMSTYIFLETRASNIIS